MAATVLIVEDEEIVADLIRSHLEPAGFRCVHAADGAAGFRLARRQDPDLVILDVRLPALDGLEVCRRLRGDPATAELPIIMLTACSAEVDRVVGLEVGADDYVVKPFSVRELGARVRALLRRAGRTAEPSVVRVGDLAIDEARHQVWVSGAPASLTPAEFRLLRMLVDARGRVLSRGQLLRGMSEHGGAAGVETRTVDVHVSRLRVKLGGAGRRLVTVKGFGYRFDLDE